MVADAADAKPACLTRRLLLGAGVSGRFLLSQRQAWAAAPRTDRPHAPPPAAAAAPPLPMVVIDPGHGGKDPGAVGISGTYEKEVALATAALLQAQLLRTGRYRVALTRTQDVFVPLDARVERAQAHGAALFVSMHADAIADHEVRGASVYTLATAASDAQTAALARRENSADRFGAAVFRDQPPEVAAILASLVRQETRAGSAAMAHRVVGALHADVGLLPNPSRHAAFVVLQAADIPSVLVEMGFMSNPEDEAALRRPDHRARVAAAMRRAVEAYFTVAGPMVRMAG
jgi:N-acetylmuramoyl-L-alanine amidase